MGTAKLYGQSSAGAKINGIIENYYVYAGENISAGDFVEFINGVATSTTKTYVDTAIDNTHTRTGYRISAVALDTTRVFIAHSYTTDNYLYGTVCKINDTTITYGTSIVIDNGNAVYGVNAILLTNGDVFLSYHANSTSTLICRICKISDMQISTLGTMYNMGNYSPGYSAVLLTLDRVFLAYSASSSSTTLHGRVCTISDTTITKGTGVTLSSSTKSGSYVCATSIANTSVFIAHSSSSSYYLYGITASISGTTVTAGTDTQLSSTTYTSRALSLDRVDTYKVFISHENSGDLYGMVCTISDTSISAGTDTHIFNYSTTTDSSALCIKPNTILVIGINNTTDYKMFGAICDITDLTITMYTPKLMNDNAYTGWLTSPVLVGSGVFVAHSYSTNYYLYAQIFGIQNNQPSSQITINTYETQVKTATTPNIHGVAQTDGIGDINTTHKDLISICRPPRPIITNLINNDGFENDFTNWTTNTHTQVFAEISTSTHYKGQKSCYAYTIANINSNGFAVEQNIDIINNHKYYISCAIYVHEVVNSEAWFGMLNIVTSRLYADTSIIGQWQSLSTVFESASDITAGRCGLLLSGSRLTNNCRVFVDDIKLYDLTDTFGAGNEPTKEWCDINFQK